MTPDLTPSVYLGEMGRRTLRIFRVPERPYTPCPESVGYVINGTRKLRHRQGVTRKTTVFFLLVFYKVSVALVFYVPISKHLEVRYRTCVFYAPISKHLKTRYRTCVFSFLFVTRPSFWFCPFFVFGQIRPAVLPSTHGGKSRVKDEKGSR